MIIYHRAKDKFLNIVKNNFLGKTYLGKRLSRKVWESQFLSGYWDYLYSEDEKGHYLGICTLYNDYQLGKKILDVGCGQGVLYSYLSKNVNSEIDYLGIDISSQAVTIAKEQFGNDKFIQLDYDRVVLEDKFDVIIFNETLYYFDQPIKTIENSIHFNLNPEGYFIISMFYLKEHNIIWEKLKEKYKFLEIKNIANDKGQRWSVGIFKSPLS